jgi:hypothetical protein
MTPMAAQAYESFARAMIMQREQARPDAFARLVGVCDGYLAFAESDAGLFHLLFVSRDVQRDDPSLMEASARAYQVLRAACLPFAPTPLPDPEIEIAVWSMVHGYALLGLNLPDSHKRSITAIPPMAQLLARLLRQNL